MPEQYLSPDMNAQHDAPYSYFQKQFVAFYDQMVLQCYGGTNAPDVQAYTSLLQQKLEAAQGQELVAVDLGCGSGRAILALLGRLEAIKQPHCKLHVYGVDNSAVFLEAAQAKCAAFLQQHQRLRSWVTVSWVLGSFEAWELPQQQHSQADFIVVAGAGMHHVTSTAGLRTAVQLAAERLTLQGVCIISYLPWTQLYRQDGSITAGRSPRGLTVEEFRVRGYKRVLLARHVEQQHDGSCVLHERFALSRLLGDDESKELWRIEEAWQLRKLERLELLALAADAGLEPSPAYLLGLGDSSQDGGGGGGGDDSAGEEQHSLHFVVFEHKQQQS